MAEIEKSVKKGRRGIDKIDRIKGKSGETLVEALVCAFIFLLMVAVMQGAITFCTNAQNKSRQIRETNARICRGIRETDISSSGSAKLNFKAVSPDGSQEGSAVLFTIDVPLGKKEVAYIDGQGVTQTIVFYLYGASAGAGGGSP